MHSMYTPGDSSRHAHFRRTCFVKAYGFVTDRVKKYFGSYETVWGTTRFQIMAGAC